MKTRADVTVSPVLLYYTYCAIFCCTGTRFGMYKLYYWVIVIFFVSDSLPVVSFNK